MSFETFKKYLSKIPTNVRIDFSGMSEPWLNKNCTKMLLEAHKRGFKIAVYTTCIGMTKKDFKRIRDIPFDIFVVHLPDAENRTKICINKKYLSVLEEICKNPPKKIKFIFYFSIHPQVQIILQKYKISSEDATSWLMGRAGNIHEYSKFSNKKEDLFCLGGDKLDHNVLLPNGDVILCCMDYSLTHRLGNLLRQDYHSIFKTTEFYRIKKSLKTGGKGTICMSCEMAIKRWSIQYLVYLLSTIKIFNSLKKIAILKIIGKRILSDS